MNQVIPWLHRAGLCLLTHPSHIQYENQAHCHCLGTSGRYFCQEVVTLTFCSINSAFKAKTKGHLPSSFHFGLLCFPTFIPVFTMNKPESCRMWIFRIHVLIFNYRGRLHFSVHLSVLHLHPGWEPFSRHCSPHSPWALTQGCHPVRKYPAAVCGNANEELLSQTHRNGRSILLLWIFAVTPCEGEQGWKTGTSCQILSTPPKAKLSLRTGLCSQQGMSIESALCSSPQQTEICPAHKGLCQHIPA